jgi:phage terminase large subunit
MKKVEVSDVYVRNHNSTARFLVNKGGARSTKSWSIAQLLCQRFWNDKKRKILVTRKTGPALHLTAYKLVVDLLKEYGFYGSCVHDKSHNTITNNHNGSMFAFMSIDDPEKIKSTEWNYIWMEEATEFTWDDFVICQTRLSGPTVPSKPNQIILSFNPTDEHAWIEQRLVQSPAFQGKVELIHSTYRDNPFLSDEYIEILESLKDQDASAYQIFALGEYGVLTDVIYSPYTLLDTFPERFDETIFGLDFGFNNPTALVQVGVRDKLNHYLEQKLYQTHLTNQQLIDKLKEVIPADKRACPIYADCAEPARIEEIERAGFNIHPSDKEVKVGIDFCKRFKYFTLASNVDLNKERTSYKWRQDKNGIVLDDPVKFNDHLMDAKRYAIYTHHKNNIHAPGLWEID